MFQAIDKDLRGAFKRHGSAAKAFKHLGKKTAGQVGTGVMRLAKGVNKMTGGENVSKFFGEKIAKMAAKPETKKYVSQTVSGKDALKSAGKVGLNAGALAVGGLAPRAINSIAKGASKGKSLKRILSKHRAGGDARMLEGLKKADPNPGMKLEVKSSPLDRTFKNKARQDIRPGARFGDNVIKLKTKRDVLKNKIGENKKQAGYGVKQETKNSKGNLQTTIRSEIARIRS